MIRKLPDNIINQIAAGEVVERPASVLKELIENAIDAGALNIEVRVVNGGKSLISVKDDGCGITQDELPLAVERHATSKLTDNDLFNINTFGFRGEALASICSIARVSIKSKSKKCDDAYELRCEKGNYDISPTMLKTGTIIEVTDLFFATPARLKFLKSDHYESDACAAVFLNAALVNPKVSFRYAEDNKERWNLSAVDDISERVADILGNEFCENMKYIDTGSDSIRISGFISVPNYNKATSSNQRFFVNGRYVKDKLLSATLKNAYKEVVPIGRYPACLLLIELNNDMVDVNVHPAKTEVRFREPDLVMSKLYGVIKKQLTSGMLGQQASSAMMRLGLQTAPQDVHQQEFSKNKTSYSQPRRYDFYKSSVLDLKHENSNVDLMESAEAYHVEAPAEEGMFGHAIAQLDNTYIVAEKAGELIIVDQHAVCERITLEKLLNRESIESQQLLLPEMVVVERSDVEIVMQNSEILSTLGMVIEKMSDDTLCVRGVPTILGECDANGLLRDIIDELHNCGTASTFENKIRLVYATMACHRSVRAGKVLSIPEMNDLLRQMEVTQNIAQCCHGRPSYLRIAANDFKHMFER